MHLKALKILSVILVAGTAWSVCVAKDAVLDSWFLEVKETVNGAFKVTLDSNASIVSLNDFQSWVVTLTDNQTGDIVSPARITVTGGMPMHGHGLPTQPQVTEYLGDGRYSLQGVKFNMHGQWMLELQINAAQTVDSVVFEVIVDY